MYHPQLCLHHCDDSISNYYYHASWHIIVSSQLYKDQGLSVQVISRVTRPFEYFEISFTSATVLLLANSVKMSHFESDQTLLKLRLEQNARQADQLYRSALRTCGDGRDLFTQAKNDISRVRVSLETVQSFLQEIDPRTETSQIIDLLGDVITKCDGLVGCMASVVDFQDATQEVQEIHMPVFPPYGINDWFSWEVHVRAAGQADLNHLREAVEWWETQHERFGKLAESVRVAIKNMHSDLEVLSKVYGSACELHPMRPTLPLFPETSTAYKALLDTIHGCCRIGQADGTDRDVVGRHQRHRWSLLTVERLSSQEYIGPLDFDIRCSRLFIRDKVGQHFMGMFLCLGR